MDTEKLSSVIDKLIALGEDKDELLYWKDIYPNLSEEKQQETLRLFEKELEKLQGVK